jgi:uncharacterized membrane protein
MQPAGIAHTLCALASLALGGVVFGLPKGTDVHRVAGMLYVFSMFGVNLTALTLYRVFGVFGLFHALAVVNLTILLLGFGAVFLRRPGRAWLQYHYYFMGWSYVWLCAATGAEVGLRIPGLSFVPAVVAPTVTITLLGGAWVQMRRHTTLRRVVGARSAA